MTKDKNAASGLSLLLLLLLLLGSGCGLAQNQETAVESADKVIPPGKIAHFEKERRRTLKNMERAMGKLPSRVNLPPFDVRYTDTLREVRYTRYSLSFQVAKNERLPVYLYVPLQGDTIRRLPAMVVLHGTDPLGKKVVDGQGSRPNRAHAKELADRGYVVVAPDYPGFGELEAYDFASDRYESGTMKGIFDHMRCVDLLQSRPEVDPNRIGIIGHSLGGHNGLFAGAFDNRLKVVVSSCGWTQLAYYDIGEAAARQYGGRLGPWAQTRYMPLLRDKFGLDGNRIPFDFDEVIAAVAPRGFLSISPLNDKNFAVEGVRAGMALAEKTYRALGSGEKLRVLYPDAGHDFPVESRRRAYQFIDAILEHRVERESTF